MSFVTRLRSDLIAVDPPWHTFLDTVRGLVHVAASDLPPGAEPAAVASITAREAESSTAMLDIGAAVPHARLEGLGDVAVALALSGLGLYEPVPTVRIRIVALVLSPPAATTDHLQVLAGVSTLLRSSALRAALLAAGDGEEVVAVLRRHTRATP